MNNEQQNKSEIAEREEKIQQFWKEKDIFKKTLLKDAPMGEFVFYDGPPYATGLPHYGHLLAGTIKDVIPRYKTMKGYRVPRRWGWDCHGLPIENLIQKELDLPTKQDIVDYGIEKFNQAARDSVLRYEMDWKEYIPRVGRFVDMDNPYKTMDPEFMESVWWVFKQLQEKGLVYKGYKSMMVSPPLETVLSNQEVNMGGYKDITDLSVTAKFTLKSGPHAGAHVLAWTTTPWTLPGNVLLAVGAEIEYVKVSSGGEKYLVGKELLEKVFEGKEYVVEAEMKGSLLVGSTYEPVFPYYKNHANAFRVVAGDFVTTIDGTGIVHIAPGFGQDDLELGQKEGVAPIQHVQMDGHFVPEVEKSLVGEGYDVAGWAVRNTTDHMHVDVEIVKYLAHHGKLFDKKKYVHSYPMCWRTDCPLINYATDSWFVDLQKIKDRLVANNKNTSWIPEHVRDGRFGKWLEEVRDWSVSRARFWGTPLPIWQSGDGETLFVGSVEELKKYTKKSGNTYFAMRHGRAQSNINHIWESGKNTTNTLLPESLGDIRENLEKLKEEYQIDVIVSSPVLRTRETAKIAAGVFGIAESEIIFDERLREINPGESYQGKPLDSYLGLFKHYKERFTTENKEGENYRDVKKRMMNTLYDLENKYQGKNILVVSHGGPITTMMMGCSGLEEEKTTDTIGDIHYPQNAQIKKFDFTPLPHNQNYELDLHRPYIDDVVLEKDGKTFKRIPDVFDVWFDSGSMPYAQEHYMGEGKKAPRFPADFIAEGQDQTRGWFYVLSVLGTALFDELPFKQVVVNGMILAEDGKKMSKRLKNYPDMNYVLDKYGADALRLFLMSSSAVHAEDLNFSEKTVQEVQSKVMGRLRNVVEFYKMYEAGEEAKDDSSNILDIWIIARLRETSSEMESALLKYEIDRASRQIFDFVDDLSTWYVRRSRDRFKGEGEDKRLAIETTRFVLREFSKMIAPYVPFVAEEMYKDVGGELESVHLESWPELSEKKGFLEKLFGEKKSDVIESMREAREVVTLGLEARQKAGVKVRQPLSNIQITKELGVEYLEVIKDELNIKNISVGDELVLDTNITSELKLEGEYRELIRTVQAMRKDAGLNPNDKIKIVLKEESKEAYGFDPKEFGQITGVVEVSFGDHFRIDKL